jgi:hypothetical protein
LLKAVKGAPMHMVISALIDSLPLDRDGVSNGMLKPWRI